jgi:hypothetical protein
MSCGWPCRWAFDCGGHPGGHGGSRGGLFEAGCEQSLTVGLLEIGHCAREVLRVEASRHLEPPVGFEGAVGHRYAPDRIRQANRASGETRESLQELGFVECAVCLAKDLPGSPDGKRCVAGEKPESADAVQRRLQPEEERLAGRERRESAIPGLPEIHFAQVRAGVQELPPSVIGVADVALHAEARSTTLSVAPRPSWSCPFEALPLTGRAFLV